MKPSKLNIAPSFLFSVVRTDLGAPMDITGRLVNPILAQVNRNDSSMTDNGRTVDYKAFFPDYRLAPGRWVLHAKVSFVCLL